MLGGTGFVGMNVARTLVRRGHEVSITRRLRANTLFARKIGAELVVADLDNVDSLVDAMRGKSVVFHCAGYYPRYSLEYDEQVALARKSTVAVLTAARKALVDRLVLTSSVATVGPPSGGTPLSSESDPMSRVARETVYFAVKEAIEDEVLSARDLDVVVACPTGIVGELDVKAGTGFVFVALSRGLLSCYVNGKMNIVDADQMAEGHLALALRGRSFERYILGGHNVTTKGFLSAVCDELGIRFRSCRMPLALAEILSTFDEIRCSLRRKGERPFLPREFVDMVRHGQWVDTRKATAELGLSPPVPLHLTIRKACAWYRRYRYIPRRDEPISQAESGNETVHFEHRRCISD